MGQIREFRLVPHKWWTFVRSCLIPEYLIDLDWHFCFLCGLRTKGAPPCSCTPKLGPSLQTKGIFLFSDYAKTDSNSHSLVMERTRKMVFIEERKKRRKKLGWLQSEDVGLATFEGLYFFLIKRRPDRLWSKRIGDRHSSLSRSPKECTNYIYIYGWTHCIG